MDMGRTSVRRELLLSMGTLFVAGLLVAFVAVLLASPFLTSPGVTVAFVGSILAADLVILFLFGRRLLDRLLLDPIDRMVEGTERIAAGDYERPIQDQQSEEMDRLVQGVNRMAERLIRDRQLLAENVRSLDETNRELVETTEQLVRTARLASVGTMASGIAHEVGNPLGALIGYLDAAERRTSHGDGAGEAVRRAREEAERIDRIVRSLLAFARPDGKGMDGGPGIDLRALVPRVLDLLATQGVTSELAVRWDPEKDLPRVEGEPQHLEQVLVNLLVNARDALATPEGDGGLGASAGEVRITARCVQRRVRAPQPRRQDDPRQVDFSHRRRGTGFHPRDRLDRAERAVELTVEDDGPGIPEEVLEHLFDPFVTTKPPGTGMGLGLAISARMVEELGGTIEAENRAHGGSRFTLLLPALASVSPAGTAVGNDAREERE